MPHDKNGQLLQVGDEVMIRAKVKSVCQGDEYCNVGVETDEPMYPSDHPTSITLNTRQVVKVVAMLLAALCFAGCEVRFDDGLRPTPVKVPKPNEEPVCNLPRGLREWNWGGGSCVHASTVMDLRWHNLLALAKWWRATYSGGESFNGLTAKLRKAQVPYYETHTGEVAILERMQRERRGAVIFFYPAHSILLVHFDQQKAIVLDNNRIEKYIAIPREKFIREWRGYGGVAIVPKLGSPAPPLPYVAAL